MAFTRISILGLGLIGSSIARAARSCLAGAELTVYDHDAETLNAAKELQLADRVAKRAKDAVKNAELVIIAVPVEAVPDLVAEIAPTLPKGAILTDVGSVKAPLCDRLEAILAEDQPFVPAHPVAGSEQSGIHAGSALMFAHKKVILTPREPESAAAKAVAAFWQALQAQVVYMPPDLHDRIYACVSHLPHYLALAVGGAVPVVESENESYLRFCRLQQSSPALWQGIFAENRENVEKYISLYLQVIHRIHDELLEGAPPESAEPAPLDDETLTRLFPYIVSSALVATVQIAEQELGVSLKEYAGSGFEDFTAPIFTDPEEVLAAISEKSGQIIALLGDFTLRLEQNQRIS